jgi:hypothetical protein
MICPRCYEETPALTHRVTSCILRLDVCYDCGVEAELINAKIGHNGKMTITSLGPTRKSRLTFIRK